jgi:molybdate transport system permease protein
MALEVRFEKRLASFTLAPDFSCEDEPLAILGPSGAGKSMTLRCIAGLEQPERGSIILNGRTLFDAEKRISVPTRQRGAGLLFQNYALFPHLTVSENVVFGLQDASPRERASRAQRQIADVHLGGLERRLPRELSGGEQQRVALARALATEPQALLLDEPLSALDTYLRSAIEQQLIVTLAKFRRPALYVTHNIEEAYRIASKLVVLSKGKVVASGPREEVFRNPPTLEVALLTGLKNFSRARAVSADSVEALDWNCVLNCANPRQASAAYVGIRAHHIGFVFEKNEPPAPNAFPCWVVRASETQFHATLFLRLHNPADASGQYHLQAEVTSEQWAIFKNQQQPWMAVLPTEKLLVLPA